MTVGPAFRAQPLGAPRRPPRLAWSKHRRDAVIVAWRPRPEGALDLASVLVTVEGEPAAEYVVAADPTDPRVADLDGTPSVVAPGGDRTLHVIGTGDLGRLLDSHSYRSGATVAAVDLLGMVGSIGGNWTSPNGRRRTWTDRKGKNHETRAKLGGFSIILDGRCLPGSRNGAKFLDAPSVQVDCFGGGVLARWAGSEISAPGDHVYERLKGPLVDLLQVGGIYCARKFYTVDDLLAGWNIPPVERDPGNIVGELRSETRALFALHSTIIEEAEQWGIPTRLGDLLTVGSLAGRLIAATRLPMLAGRFDNDLSPRLRAAGAQAFCGALHSVGAVGANLPAAHADLSACYPRIGVALGVNDYLLAEHVQPVDATSEVRDLLAAPDLATRALDPDLWDHLGITVCEVRPHGDLLPVREGVHLRLAPLDLAGDTAWWHWPDLVAATLRGGKAPEVVEAVHIAPVGRISEKLRPVTLPSGQTLDLGAGEDLLAALVAERDLIGAAHLPEAVRARRVAVAKAVANSIFGCFCRIDRQRVTREVVDRALGIDGDTLEVRCGWEEAPGPWCWLPLAGALTAGCRLLIGAVTADVEGRGGVVLHTAADAVTVAATHAAEPEPIDLGGGDRRVALPVDALDDLLARADPLLARAPHRPAFKRVAGFDRPVVAVIGGTNRVALLDVQTGETVKLSSAHLAGQAADPGGEGVDDSGEWVWANTLHTVWAAHRASGGTWPPPGLPTWIDLPWLTPGQVRDPDSLLTADQATRLHRAIRNVDRLALVFPDVDLRPGAHYMTARNPFGGGRAFSLDATPTTWRTATWRTGDGRAVRLDLRADPLDSSTMRPATIRTLLHGWTGTRGGDGLRRPTPIRCPVAAARVVGVDGGYLTAAATGDHDPEAARTCYGGGPDLAVALRRHSDGCGITDAGVIAGIVDVPVRTIQAVLAGDRRPSPSTAAAIRAALADPDRWPTPARVRICGIDRRHRYIGPHCVICGPDPTPITTASKPLVICSGCKTGFPGRVPSPCPFCARKVA